MPTTYVSHAVEPPVDAIAGPLPDTAAPPASSSAQPDTVGPIPRRKVDSVLIALGGVVTIVLLVAGGLLTWGNRFTDDYVGRELSSQNISFPAADALRTEGRTDLLAFAGQDVTSGRQAEAYASYIAGHLAGLADGATYADLGQPERAANAAVQTAVDEGAPQATVDELQAKADTITGQRNTLFKGETLRGLLLSTYAWSTIGLIAGIAALVSFVAAGAMAVLVVLGIVHRRRLTT
jgi:hypothetical protein